MEYRNPDSYYSEQLSPSPYVSDDLQTCLQLSMNQYIEEQTLNAELKYSELYSKYQKILLKYRKLNCYDSTIKDFTSYIEPIMDEYSRTGISIQLDDATFTTMMATVNSIRLNTEEKQLMNQLFSK